MVVTSENPRRDDNFGRRTGGGGGGSRLARTSATHAAGVSQAVDLQTSAWADTGDQVDAYNDSQVELSGNTKIYIQFIQGAWRITWADVCEG